MPTTKNEPELSRPLFVDKISAGGLQEHIVARASECEALAKRFGLIAINRLEAFVNVDHAQSRMLHVTGNVQADVVQACVVTLEPVPAYVKEKIDILFAPPGLLKREGEGPIPNVGDSDLPETIENGMIDLGELAAQYLALGLDPYPRKDGASLDSFKDQSGKTTVTPFAGLKDAFDKLKKTDS